VVRFEAPVPLLLLRDRNNWGGETVSVAPGRRRWAPSLPHLIRSDTEGLSKRRWMSEGLNERIGALPYGYAL